MRNLKRALSLVMAMALIVGMMVVSASAAGKDFTDKDEIQHTEAVETMVALNVISGKEDGSYFDPEGTLTRAEMAKIVAYVMNGGVEPNIGTKLVPTYSDIDNHWAEAYIEYCTSMGIIAGDGAGNFNPGGTLTASQTAKMFLTAMGYDANVFGLLGNDWETNTNRYANEAGLYDELGNVSVSAPISRDDAAQMAYNAIQATMMRRTWSQDMQTGEIGETYAPWIDNDDSGHTLLEDKFNANIEYAYMTSASYDEDRDEYSYTLDPTANFGALTIDDSIDFNGGTQDTLIYDEDVSDLFGHQVKIIYKNNAARDVYGIYAAADSTVLTSGVIGDIPDDLAAGDTSAEINDATYRFRANNSGTMANGAEHVDIYNFLNDTAVTDITGLENKAAQRVEYPFELIDNDGDGRANCVVVKPFTVEKVTYVGTSSITLDSSVGSKDLEDDINVYEGIARDDYVARTAAVYTLDDKDSVVKLDVVTGTVDAMRNGDEAQIDGVWYDFTNAYTGGTALSDTVNVGDTVTLQVVNGYYVDSEVTLAEGSANILYISAADNASTSLGTTTVKARAYFSDGSYETITIDKVNDLTANPATVALKNDGNPQRTQYLTTNTNVVVGMMYRYTVDADGNYELYTLADSSAVNRANYDKYVGEYDNISYNSTTNRLTVNGTSFAVPDDAVVYAQTTKGSNTDTRMVTGKALKNWNWTNLNANDDHLTVQVLASTVNGVSSVRVMTIVNSNNNAAISGADTTLYGYVTAVPTFINNPDGVRSQQFQIWNGSETITVFQDGTSSTVKRGDFVSYEMDGENEITSLAAIGAAYAVTGLSSNDTVLDLISESGSVVTAAKIDEDDTTVIYVDTANYAGVEGGAFTLANEPADGVYQMNVWTVSKGDGEILDIIFVDTQNVISGTNPVVAGSLGDSAIKDLSDGVYFPTNDAFAPGNVAGNPNENVIVKFTTDVATTQITLSVTDSDGDEMMENSGTPATAKEFTGLSWAANTAHYVFFDTAGSGTDDPTLTAGETYTVTITDQAGTVLYTARFVSP